MAVYRTALPQLEPDRVFLTDGGLETDLVFNHGVDLPLFAACDLLRSEEGRRMLRRYFDEYAEIATSNGLGLLLDTPTWRANPDWTHRLGYDDREFAEVNRRAAQLAAEVRDDWEREGSPMPISGVIGPRGDGYVPSARQTIDEARTYHSAQIRVLADTEVDFVAAITMNYPEEAVGIALAAEDAGMPVVISFTAETDGRLASGHPVAEAIAIVDEASGSAPAYYMVNCSHPTHLPGDLSGLDRVRGFRANASSMSHAELDESEVLDDGDPVELAGQFAEFRARMPSLTVLGGCCGTDSRHVAAIAEAAR